MIPWLLDAVRTWRFWAAFAVAGIGVLILVDFVAYYLRDFPGWRRAAWRWACARFSSSDEGEKHEEPPPVWLCPACGCETDEPAWYAFHDFSPALCPDCGAEVDVNPRWSSR